MNKSIESVLDDKTKVDKLRMVDMKVSVLHTLGNGMVFESY